METLVWDAVLQRTMATRGLGKHALRNDYVTELVDKVLMRSSQSGWAPPLPEEDFEPWLSKHHPIPDVLN